MNRNRLLCILTLFAILVLSGCTSVDKIIEDKMLSRSEIAESEEYLDYVSYEDSGSIGEDGYYIDESEKERKPIRVSLATNNNLDIQYYLDRNKTDIIDSTEVYLNPGDTIYAEVELSNNITSSTYSFEAFNIYGFKEDSRVLIESKELNDNSFVSLQIPESYTGNDIIIEPVGKYEKREISLNDYWMDDNDNKEPLANGMWFVNNIETSEDRGLISPTTSYIISYQYDKDEYFFSSSEPECFYYDNTVGTVIFPQRESMDETIDYSVELRKYMSVVLVSPNDRKVKVDSREEQRVPRNDELVISHLKYGDKITIETDTPWSELERERDIILIGSESISEGWYRYTLIVPEKDGQFKFDPKEYKYEHGSIKFKCFGSVVDSVQYLAKGSRIKYEAEKVDAGYWLAPGDHFIIVSNEEETERQLKEIHFTKKVETTVYLNQPEYGGKITYSINDNEINESSIKAYSGDIILLNYSPWPGWDCSPHKDGEKFCIPANQSAVTVTAGGESVSTIFKETDRHKPTLKVILDKSVGQEMRFTVSASGIPPEEQKYEGQWNLADYPLVSGKKIGTEKPIVITMEKDSIPPKKAIKLLIEKDSRISDVRYITGDLTENAKPINIYEPSEVTDTSKDWYSDIKITISIVDIKAFQEPIAGERQYTVVRNADTLKVLKQGDPIQESQDIILTISPEVGYYIVGGNTENNSAYQTKLSYSKYLSSINDIMNDHNAKCICTVSLGTKDSFAQYTYKYNGTIVSGKNVQLREGQELTLEYEIVNDSYKVKPKKGSLFNLGVINNKVTKSIVVSSDMDGSDIDRIDFGIEIEEVK